MRTGEQPAPGPSNKRKARIFVVDDHPLVRRGFHVLLGLEPDLELCGEAAGANEAFTQITALKPDVAVVDLILKEGSGLELIRRLRRDCPEIKITVFSMHSAPSYACDAKEAGADDYVAKTEGADRLLAAIRALLTKRNCG